MNDLDSSGAIKSCSQCRLSSANPSQCFCSFSKETLEAFGGIVYSTINPSGVRLFDEGQPSRGVYILCNGRAKLSLSSSSGKSLMRLVGPGEILGLSATISGHPYEESAEMLEAGQVNFIRRDHFLGLLRDHHEACWQTIKALSDNCHEVNDRVRMLALSESAVERLVRLLLGWCERDGREDGEGIHLKVSITHGEIAQMIGATRETVTRILGDLKDRQVIHLKGVNLLIPDKAALESVIQP